MKLRKNGGGIIFAFILLETKGGWFFMEAELLVDKMDEVFVSNFMKNVVKSLQLFSQNTDPVLIQGETGTGKDTFANYIYMLYKEEPKFLHTINCYALNDIMLDNLVTSILNQKFEKNTTLMLYFNDVSELSLSAQNFLLRFLEGYSNKKNPLDVKIKLISSTTKSINELIVSNMFKEQLYYRISTQLIYISPLRARTEDIMPLFRFFMNSFKCDFKLTTEVENMLVNYPWPGNMRELYNTVKQLATLNVTEIQKEFLPYPIIHYFNR
ncbi:MAG: sigma 54-interacting transcriptional regulator [Planctomycetota bacterium]